MKTIFKFSSTLIFLMLIFCIATPFNASAENFVFKTSLVQEVTRNITPTAAVDCNGNSTPATPVPYTAVEVVPAADIPAVSFRVYYTDDLNNPIYNYLNNSLGTVNHNATTGEISYTMTGIAQTRKSLTARVYLNAAGTGTPFESKEFYTSAANTNPPIGTIIPYYGSSVSSTVNLGGWFLCDGTSIASISDDVLFPAEKTTLQGIIGSANLPDLRGVFLRGIDPSGTYDPSAGRAPGSLQMSEITGHTHNYDKANTPTGDHNVTLNQTSTTVSDDGNNQVSVIQSVSLSGGNHNHTNAYTTTATSSAGSGTETRPVNKAVNYLIKVRY